MSIMARKIGKTVRFDVKGTLALGRGGGGLERAVGRAIETGARRILVDASGIRFLDAAGLGELVACRTRADKARVDFRLCGINEKVWELLRITGLDRRLFRRMSSTGSPRLRWRVA